MWASFRVLTLSPLSVKSMQPQSPLFEQEQQRRLDIPMARPRRTSHVASERRAGRIRRAWIDSFGALARRFAGAGGEVAEFTDCPICLLIVNAPHESEQSTLGKRR